LQCGVVYDRLRKLYKAFHLPFKALVKTPVKAP
jgi:hypothetical protein